MDHALLQQHLLTVCRCAERGLRADGQTIPGRVLREHRERGDNEWKLFVVAGPDLLREGSGPMILCAELYEVVVEPHDYRDDVDEVEDVPRGRLRISGEFPDLIVQFAAWLLERGWRGERGQLVSHDAEHLELLAADSVAYLLERVAGREGRERIES